MTTADAGERFRDLRDSEERNSVLLELPRRRRATVVAIVAAIAILAASLSGCASAGSTAQSNGTQTPPANSTPTRLRMHALGDGLFCVTQLAWSPDSTRIAAVGNAVSCSGAASGRTPGLILIYSVASGRLLQKLQPDTAVLALPAIAQKVTANSAAGGLISTLTYQGLTWTPDSQALLMTFDLELVPTPNGNGCCISIYGLQRLGVMDASSTKVWLDTSASQFAPLERWNLTAGTTDVPPAPPKATGYQWNADGTLAPTGPSAGQPVGAPDGGTTFTVWQPGQLLFATKPDKATGATTIVVQDIAWVSYVSPVSPDGRYFYPNMVNAGSLVPPSTQHVTDDEPVLQPHDQALAALAQQMMRAPTPSQNTSTLIAWRPDGRYLAALIPDATTPNPAAFTIAVYDTASGKLVKQVAPDFTGLSTDAHGSVALLWSPDGSRLLLLDNLYGAITVWGPGALPA